MCNLIFRRLAFAAMCCLSLNNAYACLDNKSIAQLKANEELYLASRNVATMTDAIEDKLLSVDVEQEKSEVKQAEDACNVTITYTVSSADIDEANQLLSANPAKRIMLAGQGYELPSQTRLIATVGVKPDTLSIQHKDILQSAALGKNRASVELLYATLAQTRATVSPQSINTERWPASLLDQEISLCESQYTSESNVNGCTCKTDAISKKVSPRQLKYIKYLANDPYSSATGALSSYKELSDQVNFECKLKKR